jgi:type I restriction-modification system DNA methylase subunit
MKKEQQTFASTMKLFEYRFDLRTVFDDFLTMSLCAMGQNPHTKKSYDETLYLETVAKYKDDKLRFEFPHLYAHVVTEMTERWDSSEGYDVLGEFYETNLYRKGASQYFTPWPICTFMAECTAEQVKDKIEGKTEAPLRILDPSCGSGRMLMASQKINGQHHEYYGVDIDHTCIKMTALNLILSGLFHGEALFADALIPEDFNMSYRTSFLPFGVFRIQDKENSPLWHMLKNSWDRPKPQTPKPEYDGVTSKYSDGAQLQIF